MKCVIFNKDLELEGKLIFKKDLRYLILDEDESSIYVSINGSDVMCSQFNKSLEGELFKYD